MRTHVSADAAVDAVGGHLEVFLAFQQEAHLGIYVRSLEEFPMLLAFLLSDWFMPPALLPQVGRYAFKAFGNVLVHLHLFVHVEVGQPVVNHDHGSDIVEGIVGPA